MLRVTSGTVGIDSGNVILFSDFENGGTMWRGEGPRQSRANVTFSQPYNGKPHVQVSVSMLDISNSSNLRMDVVAEDVTESGFTIVFRTWADTQVARVSVAWTAIGALQNDDGWELY